MLGVNVEALAELEKQRLTRVADKFGIAKRYRDHVALLEDPDIDVVAVLRKDRGRIFP